MDARMLDILACPVCKGTLRYQREAQALVCRMDRLAFPVRDGDLACPGHAKFLNPDGFARR